MASATQQLAGLGTLLDTVGKLTGTKVGQSQTSTGSSSTKSNISDTGMNRVIQQILAGPGGVKDISGAARGAGLYNASSEAQMLNDLTARASGEAEKLRAGTETVNTTQTTGETVVPSMLPSLGGGGLGSVAAMLAAPSAIKGLGGVLSSVLGGSSGAAAAVPSLTGLSTGGVNLGSALLSSGVDAAAFGGNMISNLAGSQAVDLASTLGSSAGMTTSFASNLGASGLGASALPGIGGFASGLMGGGFNSGTPLNLASSAAAGFAAGGPVGAIVGLGANLLGSIIGDSSIVCTALMSRGLLDKNKYAKGQAYLQGMNRDTLNGYYFLFTDIATKIMQGSKFWTAVCLPFARSRTNLIAEGSGYARWIKHPLGTITKVIGEPICWLVGKLVRNSAGLTT